MSLQLELDDVKRRIVDKEALITDLEKQLLPPNENNAELKIDLKNAILSLNDLKADYRAFRTELLQAQTTQQKTGVDLFHALIVGILL